MPRAAVGLPLVECENDRAVGHVTHMPHRPVMKRGDLHQKPFREKKKAGAAPEGTAPAVRKTKKLTSRDARQLLAATAFDRPSWPEQVETLPR